MVKGLSTAPISTLGPLCRSSKVVSEESRTLYGLFYRPSMPESRASATLSLKSTGRLLRMWERTLVSSVSWACGRNSVLDCELQRYELSVLQRCLAANKCLGIE